MNAATTPRLVRGAEGQGVRVYAGERTEPESEVLNRLLEISRIPSVAAPVVALPDLHWKDRLETPSSTAIATGADIVMSFSSPSQNCGMNLILTPLSSSDLSERRVDELMDRLREAIPRRRREPVLDTDEVLDFCRNGAPAAARRFDVDPGSCSRIEFSGNVFAGREPDPETIASVMDPACIDVGRYSFAFIGGGNHFLELQVVTDVMDETACSRMGLERDRVVAMFHTGSERLGHDLGRLYSWRRKTDPRRRRKLFWRKVALHLARDVRGLADLRIRWDRHFRRRDYVAVPAASREGERLRITLGIAANYGYANRVAVAGLMRKAFGALLGADVDMPIIADLSHNTIQRERIGGRELWVHRHNAARTVGPSGLDAEHPYRDIGQPVMIPGTNRTSSFVVVGRDGAEASLHSVDHGAGRTVERFAEAGLLSDRSERSTRKYGYRSPIVERVPHAGDEGIEEVITVLAQGGIASPAARLRPVAVLKA